MLDKEEFIEEIKFSTGERFNPLFSSVTFEKVCNSCYNFIFCKQLSLDFSDVKQRFLEDLQEWEHIKSNFIPQTIEKNPETERIREMFLKEKELIRSQL